MTVERNERLEKLRREILDLQGLRTPLERDGAVPLGAMNDAFPNGAFPVSAVHEFISRTPEESAATSGFTMALLSFLTNGGVCLWVSAKRLVFPPALKTFGLTSGQVVFVTVPNDKDRLWTIEEGLKCGVLSAVVGEVSDLTFTESRRLQLAVENSHVTGFIHRRTSKSLNKVACVSRWNIRPVASETGEAPGVGFTRWEASLLKIRNGKPGIWDVMWIDQKFKVSDPRIKEMDFPMIKAG